MRPDPGRLLSEALEAIARADEREQARREAEQRWQERLATLAARLSAVPGVVAHGLFPPEMVSEVLVGRPGGRVDRLPGPRA